MTCYFFRHLALIAILAGATAPVASAIGFERCTNVPASELNAVVKVCESLSHYIFKIADTTEAIEKTEFQSQLIRLTKQWLDLNGFEQKYLLGSTVEIWMSVPEANPAGAKIRAFFQTTHGNFVISLPVSPKDWTVSNDNVGVTDQEHYPQSYGYRAGSLLIKKVKEAKEETFLDLVESYSESPVQSFSPSWYSIETSVFSEKPVSSALQRNGTGLVESVNFNHVMEWMAWRERVFAFSVQTIP